VNLTQEEKAHAWEIAAAILLRQCREGSPLEHTFSAKLLRHIRDAVVPSVQERGARIRLRQMRKDGAL
jgi:hypothetical protein